MCARIPAPLTSLHQAEAGPHFKAKWIHTTESIRERSRSVIHLPSYSRFACVPSQVSIREHYCECGLTWTLARCVGLFSKRQIALR